ncbi:hypothetical protein [Methylacidimicrobium sp. B4]|uniref:hypothetical protein n=1 Tax=Methylacidimicrobium sp. B4 TaxID=2796139 RepID=UPI001A8C56EE|nr:hypothetical protein [Methylacidimicrobium sp. B4]QSR84845.1 hypothetical protein MacB4_00750 [Methylacidimicrobium sp. B4]
MSRRGGLFRLCSSLLLFSLGALATGSLSAEEADGLRTTPPLSVAFPLVQQGREVRLTYPIAINERTVVRPDARLHCLYAKPKIGRASGEEGELERALRRRVMPLDGLGLGSMRIGTTVETLPGTNPNGSQDGNLRHGVDGTTVWTSTDAFRKALSGLGGSDLQLVFSLPAPIVQEVEPAGEGEEKPGAKPHWRPRRVWDEPLVLPLGLLLAQRKGAPTVLAIEEGSEAERAGLRVKDRIVSLDGRRFPKSLSGFLALYRQEKSRGLKALRLVVERAGHLSPVSLTVPLPPRSDGSIVDAPGG